VSQIDSRQAHYGFNCIKLADDWQGADFLAYHHNGDSSILRSVFVPLLFLFKALVQAYTKVKNFDDNISLKLTLFFIISSLTDCFKLTNAKFSL